ncbi:MAG: iron transporter [Rhodospirillaceae bacterium]|nr:MAG: iron transporter [Rhodospirillaceae bacterium]
MPTAAVWFLEVISKPTLFRLHKWCGLAAAIFVLVQAVTGAILLYRQEISRVVDPSGMVRHSKGADAPLSQILNSIRRNSPDFQIQRVVYPQNRDDPYFVYLANAVGVMRYASVDPGTAEILRLGSAWQFPTQAALLIHYQLMAGRLGLGFVLLLGLSLLTSVVSGMTYWWPRQWRGSLSVNFSLSPRLILRQLHRSLGVVASAVLCVSLLTGVLLVIPLLLAPSPLPAAAQDPPFVSKIDRIVDLARAEFPNHDLSYVEMTNPTSIIVNLRAPERNPLAIHSVEFDLASERMVGKIPADKDSSLWVVVLPIHMGIILGNEGRFIILLGAFALAALSISGVLMWYQAARHRNGRP